MTEKELRALSRKELLSMMLAQNSEIERLTEVLEKSRKELECRDLPFEERGSFPEITADVLQYAEEVQAEAERYLAELERILKE